MALAAWGLAGLFLAADFFAEICPMPESGTLRKAAGAAVSASEGNMVRPGEQKEEKYIALTFDDGPHRLYTPRLLDGLKKRGVHATFFLIGQNIEGNEDIIRLQRSRQKRRATR